ncbi:MAG: glycosyltransferase family 4 protein, partial [Rhodomicrobium sp.]
PIEVGGMPVGACRGNKALFAARALAAAMRSSAVLYDALGVSRAHLASLSRYAVWVHGVEIWHGLTPAYAASLRRADLAICNTQFTLNRHEAMHGKLPQARVCWLGTEEGQPPARLADFTGPPTALIVGRIDATEGLKGHAELIGAWPAVMAAVPQAKLVIAGGGSGLEAVRHSAAASPAAASIEILGFVEASRLPALYESAHVFAMPSRQEGFGIAYAEAMRYGVPCIASRQDGGQEVNAGGVTGFNVDLDQPGALARVLIELLASPDRAKAMGLAAHNRWREHFASGRFAARFLNCWRDFTTGHANGRLIG